MIDARSREMEEKLKTQYDDRIRNLQSQLEETQQAAAARETERQKELERLAAERKAAQEAQLRREEEARKAAAAAAAPPPQTTTPAGGTGQPAASSTTQAQAPPEPPAPKVVQVKPPELLRRPDPRYPPIARRVGKEATVVLRVLVDARGGVTKVEQISPQAGFGIDQAAEEAARNAEYRPGTEDGKPKEMWTTIRFTFRP
jgi:TonB family protein